PHCSRLDLLPWGSFACRSRHAGFGLLAVAHWLGNLPFFLFRRADRELSRWRSGPSLPAGAGYGTADDGSGQYILRRRTPEFVGVEWHCDVGCWRPAVVGSRRSRSSASRSPFRRLRAPDRTHHLRSFGEGWHWCPYIAQSASLRGMALAL